MARLVTLLETNDFLDILPNDGSLKFFLPYIIRSYQWNLAQNMKAELLDDLNSPSGWNQ